MADPTVLGTIQSVLIIAAVAPIACRATTPWIPAFARMTQKESLHRWWPRLAVYRSGRTG